MDAPDLHFVPRAAGDRALSRQAVLRVPQRAADAQGRTVTRRTARGAASWLVTLALFGLAAGLHAQVVQCDRCHANRDFLVGKGRPGQETDLYVPGARLAGTRHESLECQDCHVGYGDGYPHSAASIVVPCQSCHEGPGRRWEMSVHATNVVERGDAPTCVGCHGSHVVLGVEDRESPIHPLNVAAMCGRCHADSRITGTYFASADKTEARTAVAHYYQTVHGNALTRDGLIVSATCNDCHRAHDILPADSAASSVNRNHIPETCGACHVGIVEVYDHSAHGEAYREGRVNDSGHEAPVCVDCHSAHGIVRADEPQWLLGAVEECGTCHEQLYSTYFETYHGKVTRLGFSLAAMCSDCHTAHNMRSASDPESTVFPANVVETCANCHARANANFARYQVHADPKDRRESGILFWTWLGMTSLLIGVMSFFGLHTGLWLLRLALDRARGRPRRITRDQVTG